jgi:hypothetical protein
LPAIQNSGDPEAAKEPKKGRIANKNRKKSTKNDEDFEEFY